MDDCQQEVGARCRVSTHILPKDRGALAWHGDPNPLLLVQALVLAPILVLVLALALVL